MKIKAKMQCNIVEKTEWAETVKFAAVYSENNSEDNTFAAATPSGILELTVTNKSVHGHFQPGRKYYVDITEATA